MYLDDETLRYFNETWPPSHKIHSEILRAILDYHPAAVLVDFFFVHIAPGDNFDRTQTAIKEYQDKYVPLFVVWAQDVRPEVWKLANDVANKSGYKIALVSGDLAGDPGHPIYPLDNLRGLRSAALALYSSVCRISDQPEAPETDSLKRLRDRAPGCKKERLLSSHEGLSLTHQMGVVWGLYPAAYNCNGGAESLCKDLFRSSQPLLSVIGRTFQLLWEGLLPPIYRPTDPLHVHYHAEISARHFFGENNQSELGGLLAGKLVIYSSNVPAAKDVFVSPVQGEVPGALVHAMALDNLLTFGNRYIHESEEGHFRKNPAEFLPSIVMAAVSLLVIWRRGQMLRDARVHRSLYLLRNKDERLLLRVYWVLVGTLIACGTIEFFVFRIAPFNWLGLWIVVHMAHRVDKWFFRKVENEAEAAGWIGQLAKRNDPKVAP